MKKETIDKTILKYLRHLSNSKWILEEAYKFEFANYLQYKIDFQIQSDKEIFEILLDSQLIKYDTTSRGVQFIQKSGRKKLGVFIQQDDISLFRKFQTDGFESVDWKNRTMSFTGLSVWLSSLFPDKFFPIPAIKLDTTINYLFETNLSSFPKKGKRYVLSCQEFMKQTQDELKKYPVEEIHLKVWNKFFTDNPALDIKPKKLFEQVDWNWLAQDFHIFVLRKVLNLYNPLKPVNTSINSLDDFEPIGIEGESKLAIHMRYERDNSLIRKIKEAAIKANPMLNCEVCGFSFFEKYGELGYGFIEAHHRQPLSETQKTVTKKDDIALVCSNCHRMIHRRIAELANASIMTIQELKAIIKE